MSEKNYDSLRKFGEFQDSFDDVITKILNKIDTIVASLSIKRIPESGILNEVKTQIGKKR